MRQVRRRRADVDQWLRSKGGAWHAFIGKNSTHSQCGLLDRSAPVARRLASRKTVPEGKYRVCGECQRMIGLRRRKKTSATMALGELATFL